MDLKNQNTRNKKNHDKSNFLDKVAENTILRAF